MMTQRMHPRTNRFPIAALLFAVAATAALAQQAARPADVPTLPARGPLTVSAEAITEILAGIKAPQGFEVKVFATPPIVNYPTCITATLTGELFVCVDRNSSLQADPGMGSILRLVDRNNDGQADDYTVFATMDSPRGAVFDGDTLFVTHPPSLTAYRDGDGDGIAEESRTLVRGLGFGLDFRGADHTVNGVELGIDGWLYIAVGDYGLVKAVGSDGREIQMRGGGNVRVRRDGTGLEIYSRGTRNDYDVAIDPYLNLFARGNTNDGGGWDIRLNHFVAGARYGYPSLFRNFSDEVVAPLADYGGGSGTGMLFVQDPGLPAPFGDALYSVDWGTNFIYRHPLQPRGASFTAGQEVFLGLPRPTDIVVDGASRLFAASWKGGQYRYAGEQIGYIARLTYPGRKARSNSRGRERDRCAPRRARHVGQPGAPAVCPARARPSRPGAGPNRAARETRARPGLSPCAGISHLYVEAARRRRVSRPPGSGRCRSSGPRVCVTRVGRSSRRVDERTQGIVCPVARRR